MNDRVQDGCPEYDEMLMDLAVEPIADPSLEAHLAICERCRAAHERYLETARVIGAAFTLGPGRARPVRQGLRIVHALAAVVLTAASVYLASQFQPRAPLANLTVHPEEGTTVHLIGPDKAVIESGTSTFVIRDPGTVVETPAGWFTCENCEFTLHVDECESCVPVLRFACEPEPMCVTLFVAAGIVGGVFENHCTPVGPGETLTWPIAGRSLLETGLTP